MGVDRPLCLGLEIGGTKLQLGIGRADGTILALERRVIQPEAGASRILEQIVDAYPALLARPEAGGLVPSALGIGFGGPVDADRGRILRSHQVNGWDGFDLAAWGTEALGIPVVAIENDADVAGLGEATQGAGVGVSPVFYVTIGSGIGGGLILDGQIYRGSGTGAAEVGHLWIDDPTFGSRKLEEIASGWAIGRAARDLFNFAPGRGPLGTIAAGDASKIDGSAVGRAAAEGDPQALAILATASRAVGQALAHVVTLLAPRRIILGGGVSLMRGDLWLEPIRRELEARVFPPFLGTFDLVDAALGEQVVIHGALAIAAERWLKSR